MAEAAVETNKLTETETNESADYSTFIFRNCLTTSPAPGTLILTPGCSSNASTYAPLKNLKNRFPDLFCRISKDLSNVSPLGSPQSVAAPPLGQFTLRELENAIIRYCDGYGYDQLPYLATAQYGCIKHDAEASPERRANTIRVARCVDNTTTMENISTIISTNQHINMSTKNEALLVSLEENSNKNEALLVSLEENSTKNETLLVSMEENSTQTETILTDHKKTTMDIQDNTDDSDDQSEDDKPRLIMAPLKVTDTPASSIAEGNAPQTYLEGYCCDTMADLNMSDDNGISSDGTDLLPIKDEDLIIDCMKTIGADPSVQTTSFTIQAPLPACYDGDLSSDENRKKKSKSKPTEQNIKKSHRKGRNSVEGHVHSRSCHGNNSLVTPDCLGPDRVFKIVIVGNAGVGKSSLVSALILGSARYAVATIGVDMVVKTFIVQSLRVSLQIWDTAGEERFHCMAPSYVRKSDAVVIVYDVTDSSSFVDIPTYWLPFVRKYLSPGRQDVSMMLLGNKTDKLGMRTITADDGANLARDEGMQFCEVSARNSISVAKVFHCLSQTLVTKENDELDKLSQLTLTLRRNEINLEANSANQSKTTCYC